MGRGWKIKHMGSALSLLLMYFSNGVKGKYNTVTFRGCNNRNHKGSPSFSSSSLFSSFALTSSVYSSVPSYSFYSFCYSFSHSLFYLFLLLFITSFPYLSSLAFFSPNNFFSLHSTYPSPYHSIFVFPFPLSLFSRTSLFPNFIPSGSFSELPLNFFLFFVCLCVGRGGGEISADLRYSLFTGQS